MTKDDCGNVCLIVPDCTHFAADKNGNCWLKRNWAGNALTVDPNLSCGYISNPTDPRPKPINATAIAPPPTIQYWTKQGPIQWADGCHFPDQYFARFDNIQIDNCASVCMAVASCTKFTAYGAGQNCWLQNDWIGVGPVITDPNARRCGFITARQKTNTITPNTIANWTTVNETINYADGCDFFAQDITVIGDISQDDCGKACMVHSDCTHYAATTGRGCYLKKNWMGKGSTPSDPKVLRCGWVSKPQPQTPPPITYWSLDAGNIYYADGCDFVGQEFTGLSNVNKQDCGRLCQSITGCTHFTAYGPGQNCWLKRNWKGQGPTNTDRDTRRCGWINRNASAIVTIGNGYYGFGNSASLGGTSDPAALQAQVANLTAQQKGNFTILDLHREIINDHLLSIFLYDQIHRRS